MRAKARGVTLKLLAGSVVALLLGGAVYALTVRWAPRRAPDPEGRQHVIRTWGALALAPPAGHARQGADTADTPPAVEAAAAPPASTADAPPATPASERRLEFAPVMLERRQAAPRVHRTARPPGQSRPRAADPRPAAPPPEEASSDDRGALPPPRPEIDRAAVSRLMAAIRPEVQRCYDQGMMPGDVALTVTVKGATGKVQQVELSAESSTASCVQSVVRGLRFEPFRQPQLRFRYQYRFR